MKHTRRGRMQYKREKIEAARESIGSIEKTAIVQPCYAPKGAG